MNNSSISLKLYDRMIFHAGIIILCLSLVELSISLIWSAMNPAHKGLCLALKTDNTGCKIHFPHEPVLIVSLTDNKFSHRLVHTALTLSSASLCLWCQKASVLVLIIQYPAHNWWLISGTWSFLEWRLRVPWFLSCNKSSSRRTATFRRTALFPPASS